VTTPILLRITRMLVGRRASGFVLVTQGRAIPSFRIRQRCGVFQDKPVGTTATSRVDGLRWPGDAFRRASRQAQTHAAECTTGPQFNHIANPVSATMTSTMRMWTVNLRVVILSTPRLVDTAGKRSVPLDTKERSTIEQPPALFGRQPIPQPNADAPPPSPGECPPPVRDLGDQRRQPRLQNDSDDPLAVSSADRRSHAVTHSSRAAPRSLVCRLQGLASNG
jgi:hypothetical protein